jgi:hypothetical protein
VYGGILTAQRRIRVAGIGSPASRIAIISAAMKYDKTLHKHGPEAAGIDETTDNEEDQASHAGGSPDPVDSL